MAKFKILFTPGATNDVNQDIDWYEQKEEGLSFKYLDDLNKTTNHAAENPNLYAKDKLCIRKALFKLFKHSVFFKVKEEEDLITVAAVVHQSRSEKTILEKLKRKV